MFIDLPKEYLAFYISDEFCASGKEYLKIESLYRQAKEAHDKGMKFCENAKNTVMTLTRRNTENFRYFEKEINDVRISYRKRDKYQNQLFSCCRRAYKACGYPNKNYSLIEKWPKKYKVFYTGWRVHEDSLHDAEILTPAQKKLNEFYAPGKKDLEEIAYLDSLAKEAFFESKKFYSDANFISGVGPIRNNDCPHKILATEQRNKARKSYQDGHKYQNEMLNYCKRAHKACQISRNPKPSSSVLSPGW